MEIQYAADASWFVLAGISRKALKLKILQAIEEEGGNSAVNGQIQIEIEYTASRLERQRGSADQ